MRRMVVFILIPVLLMGGGCQFLQNIGKTTKQVDAHGTGVDYSTGIDDPDPSAPRRSPTAMDPPS
jgi:hypothetical protein